MSDFCLRARDGRRNPAGYGDMVVFDQNRIIKTEAMIETTARPHGIFFNRAQTGGRFARVANARCGVRHKCAQLRGLACNARHVAQKIQRHALCAQ